MKDVTPALGFRSLTRIYDPVVALTLRERRFKSQLIEHAMIRDGQRLLDLGCGTGTLAISAKLSHPRAQVIGVDADPEVLELARTKAEATDAQIDLIESQASALPFPDEFFDCVISSLFFHHLKDENKLQALREARRVLKPGGSLVVADWGKPKGPAMRMAFYAVQALDGFEATRSSVRGLLPEMIEQAGFMIAESLDQFSTVFGTIRLYRSRKAGAH